MRNITWTTLLFRGLGVGVIATALVGCSETFEPFRPDNDLQFSMFGYLDAAVDTQWIRVTAVRQSILTTPDRLDAIVTLEHMGTGETVILQDSVFRFVPFGVAESTDSFVHNFWTDAPLEPGATYRLSVTGADGISATTEVPVPEEVSEVVVLTRVGSPLFNDPHPTADFVQVEGVAGIATVQVVHYISDRVQIDTLGTFADCTLPSSAPRIHWIRQPLHHGTVSEGVREVPVARTLNSILLTPGTGRRCQVAKREVVIAVSGAEWPVGPGLSVNAPTTEELPSAVEGGLGFVGGVVTITAPFEDCLIRPPFPGVSIVGSVCRMVYNAESAALSGRVTDPICGIPIEGAEVQLLPIFEDPGGPVIVRRVATDREGAYRIGGLSSGQAHILRVRHPAQWPPDARPGDPTLDVYRSLEDTLVFDRGQDMASEIELERLVACG